MNAEREAMNCLLDFLVELLDIPPSHYRQAADRYQSLGEWLHRKESTVAPFSPEVYPQGSFRYGTVIRPLLQSEEYDLDLVFQMDLSKDNITQEKVKHLVGEEIKAYAEAHSFKEPAEEKPRCWRLNYADDISFHMDILPCIPENKKVIDFLCRSLSGSGLPIQYAIAAVAITDKRHPKFTVIDPNDWPSSNPRGIAEWFEDRMRPVARGRIAKLVEKQVYASVDDVPAYDWKTPLQRSIQILKRHRDVMFRDSPEWKPLSMIITTLAAHAYNGETDLYDALSTIVEGMSRYVSSSQLRIPNPVNPKEDFADRWAKDIRYEQNFGVWHAQFKADLNDLRRHSGEVPDIKCVVQKKFALELTADMEKRLEAGSMVPAPHIAMPAPVIHIASAPKPWRRDG